MIKNMVANRGWLAAIAASTLVAIVGALAFASIAAAAPTISLSADNSTPAPGDTVVVSVNVSGTGANAVGGLVGTITFDPSKLTATTCTGTCNTDPPSGAGNVSIAAFSATGLSGEVATVDFTVKPGVSGAVAVAMTIEQCTEATADAAPRTDCANPSTTITVGQVVTASPSPSAAAATPAATAGGFGNTGGNPSDGSSSSALPLALAALGLVTIGGAAWAVARTRRIAG